MKTSNPIVLTVTRYLHLVAVARAVMNGWKIEASSEDVYLAQVLMAQSPPFARLANSIRPEGSG